MHVSTIIKRSLFVDELIRRTCQEQDLDMDDLPEECILENPIFLAGVRHAWNLMLRAKNLANRDEYFYGLWEIQDLLRALSKTKPVDIIGVKQLNDTHVILALEVINV